MTHPSDERFLEIANSPVHWALSGITLRKCAEVLGELHRDAIRAAMSGSESSAVLRHLTGTGQVFQMLAGLAIENLVKGLLLHRKKVAVTKVEITGADLKGHGAERLLRRAGVKLADDERQLVRRLDKAVDWSGRYPVPLKASTLAAQPQHESSINDVDDFGRLFRRLAAELPTRGELQIVLHPPMPLDSRHQQPRRRR